MHRVATEPEDPRYAEMRARWGGNLGAKFFALFVGQGILDVILAVPFFLAGLWNWSRHPNYFFDWLIWCAFALLALGSPLGWLALFPPMLMLYFLTRVTGIAATEAHAVRSRGEAYRRYQREVGAFMPWPPPVER